MKMEIIQNEKNTLEFYLLNERHTISNLLKEKLVKNGDVEFCAYKLDHPLEDKSRFILKTNGKNPKKVLEEAIKEIKEELEEFKKAFDKMK
ncbi:MAG TPA: RpoL/Rpb11 RNA polymerase subunit family protein [archaeon]|nr:RpoL/Rpb11 RNA polymerase subunit family protein [archaeon]